MSMLVGVYHQQVLEENNAHQVAMAGTNYSVVKIQYICAIVFLFWSYTKPFYMCLLWQHIY